MSARAGVWHQPRRSGLVFSCGIGPLPSAEELRRETPLREAAEDLRSFLTVESPCFWVAAVRAGRKRIEVTCTRGIAQARAERLLPDEWIGWPVAFRFGEMEVRS
jgi:hypothetical protein